MACTNISKKIIVIWLIWFYNWLIDSFIYFPFYINKIYSSTTVSATSASTTGSTGGIYGFSLIDLIKYLIGSAGFSIINLIIIIYINNNKKKINRNKLI